MKLREWWIAPVDKYSDMDQISEIEIIDGGWFHVREVVPNSVTIAREEFQAKTEKWRITSEEIWDVVGIEELEVEIFGPPQTPKAKGRE